MPIPALPQPAPGEVLLVCTCYDDGKALWGEVLDGIGGGRDGDVLVLADGAVRLRPVENAAWDFLRTQWWTHSQALLTSAIRWYVVAAVLALVVVALRVGRGVLRRRTSSKS